MKPDADVFWATAVVIGRILAEDGSPPPDVDDPALLLIKRYNVTVGCSPGDAGVGGDAALDGLFDGGAGDAGLRDAVTGDAATADAGIGDAGTYDGGIGDGGLPDAGTCTMIPGDAVTMIVQPHVSTTTDGTRFAVLLVTPERPIVEVQQQVFEQLAALTDPRTEYRTVKIPDEAKGKICTDDRAGCFTVTFGGGGCVAPEDTDGDYWDPPGLGDGGLGDGRLVEEMIGPYQFVRAKPTNASELAGWLDQLGYAYMQDDLDAVSPYIDLGYQVVAIRVVLHKQYEARLTPVALTWPGNELRVPASLGRGAVSPGRVTVYIAADGKYVLPDAAISYAKWTSSGDMGFLTRNEIMLDQNQPPASDPIAVRGDDRDVDNVTIVTNEVRVPVKGPCGTAGCCSDCNATPRNRIDLLLVVGVVAFVLRRRRR